MDNLSGKSLILFFRISYSFIQNVKYMIYIPTRNGYCFFIVSNCFLTIGNNFKLVINLLIDVQMTINYSCSERQTFFAN